MRRFIARLLLVFGTAAAVAAQTPALPYLFTTFAGAGGSSGHVDGIGSAARFARPWGLTIDPQGNLYVTEIANHTVRQITPAGVVTTLAGRPGVAGWLDGPIATALLGGSTATPPGTSAVSVLPTGPFGLARDARGNVYVADSLFHTIRQITPAGSVGTLAGFPLVHGAIDGPAATAQFKVPFGVTALPEGSLLVADTYNHVIRKISATGTVSTVAGIPGGAGSRDTTSQLAALFLHPCAVISGPNGSLYVTDANNLVRRLTPDSASGATTYTVTTLAGSVLAGGSIDGQGSAARFGAAVETLLGISMPFTQGPSSGPGPSGGPVSLYAVGGLTGLALAPDGNLIVVDYHNHTIRQVTPAGLVTTIGGRAGTRGRVNGAGTDATFSSPAGVAIDTAGNLYIADSNNHTIRKGTRAVRPLIQPPAEFTSLAVGATHTITASVAAYPAPTYQWAKNGLSLAGATTASLTLANLTAADTGSYTLTAANDFGTATSTPARINVVAPLVIAQQPVGRTWASGETITLSVVANASVDTTYQWFRDGTPLADGVSATLLLPNARPAHAGTYTVTLTNAAGSISSTAAVVTLASGKIVNLSVRSALAPGQNLTVGFVVTGAGKPLLIRAIGPALRPFGLAAVLADPTLTLFASGGPAGAGDNWGESSLAPQIAAVAQRVGAFALPVGSLDAALLTTVGNAALTVQAGGKNSADGIVLVELYDTAPENDARLVNVSTRALVGSGDALLAAGFVIAGTIPQKVLLRAIGPTLAGFGVPGTLSDPKLELFAAGTSTPLATNDNWGGDPSLVAAFAAVGAFPLPSPASRDAALVLTLPPGSYSAQVTGVGGTTGEVLLEVYERP